MATRPSVSATLVAGGGGIARGADALAVFFCSSQGPFTARLVRKYSDVVSTYGAGIAAEFASHFFSLTPKPLLMVRMPTVAAGSIGPTNNQSVTGTSVVSWSGTPVDRESLRVVVVTGGTVGTAGIVIKVSRDGGRVYGPNVRLGTATSYVIPATGVTVAFAAGTLVAGDFATAECYPPASDGAGLTAARVALAAQSVLCRAGIVLSDVNTADELQDIIDEAEAYETTDGRHIQIFAQLRAPYPTALMQGDPTDVDFDSTADTITRNTGSWITDGFRVGMDVAIAGSVSNNGAKGAIVTVTTTVLTLPSAPGLSTEANVLGSGLTITASESKIAWANALAASIVGNSVATLKTSSRVLVRAGNPRRKSPANGTRKQRPFAWFSAIQTMAHERHVSEAKVSLGPLSGLTITDPDGVLETHDERVDGTLLVHRIGCPTTLDDIPGVFSALPLTLAEDDGQLSRAPVGAVGDLLCRLAKREATRKLGSDLVLQSDGSIAPEGLARINREITAVLRAAVISPGPEGPMASDVSFAMDGTVDLRVPGANVPCEVSYLPLGYLEQITIRVVVSRAGATEEG